MTTLFLGEDGSGTVVLQMQSKWDAKKNVQWVHGEVALRDGSYITESDLHLHMGGGGRMFCSVWLLAFVSTYPSRRYVFSSLLPPPSFLLRF
jgi:hypothetical protein